MPASFAANAVAGTIDSTIMADSARLVNRFFIIEPDLLSVSVMQRSAKLCFRLGLHGGNVRVSAGGLPGRASFLGSVFAQYAVFYKFANVCDWIYYIIIQGTLLVNDASYNFLEQKIAQMTDEYENS